MPPDTTRPDTTPPDSPPQPPALHVRGVVLPADESRDLYVVDGRVTYEPVPDAELVGTGWILPGLVDAHCHIGLGPDGGVPVDETERQAIIERDAGMLLARDCGVPVDTHWIDDRPDLPRIVRAGRHIARTRRYLRHYGVEIEPDALPHVAAEQAARGDGWVKIVGDWIDRDAGRLAPCWPPEALAEAVAAAHAAGARVTTHVFGADALPDLLAAGVDCVEHGTGLDDALLTLMAERSVALVPTLINVDTFPAIAEQAARFPAYADQMRQLHSGARDLVQSAYEAGVQVFAGTDAGGGISHGRIAEEVRALREAGLPVDAALGAASWRAREWLGFPPGLDEGASADLVVYDADPRSDLTTLARPVRVVLRGRVVR